MDKLKVCRVCLTDSVKMHRIAGTEFKELYEKLADTKLEAEDRRPTMLCYICYPHLVRCCKFLQMAKRSETVLTQLYNTGVVLTQDLLIMLDRPPVHSYSVTPIESVNIYSETKEVLSNNTNISKEVQLDTVDNLQEVALNPDDVEQLTQRIKDELYEKLKVKDAVKETTADYIKEDPDGNGMEGHTNGNADGDSNCDPDLNEEKTNFDSDTDPEDDLPLTCLKIEGQVTKRRKVKVKSQKVKEEKLKRQYRKRLTLDVRVIHLTKEQQLQEMAARSASLNYMSSAHQCALCLRGFSSAIAFANHQEKHEESSGPFECDMCRVRYRTPRHLRTHLAAAHSRYYRCNKCGHLAHTTHQAIDHQRWHSGYKYECQLCGHEFMKRSSYLTHLRKWHPTEYICNICGDRFIGRHGLAMHKSKAHLRSHEVQEDGSGAAERFCSTCDMQFVTLDAWKRHILASIKHTVHNKDNDYCEICRVPAGGALALHMKRHAKELLAPRRERSSPADLAHLRVTCEQCGESFMNKGKLSSHIRRVHLGLTYNKDIVCEVCGKKCVSNASLVYHQRTHTGERPYKCSTCSKTFFNKDHLRIHTRTHTGEKPYSCEHCAKTFTQKPTLNRHYRVHTGAKPYSCSLCGKSFSQSNTLKGHVTAVHLKMAPYRGKKKEKVTQEVVGHSESV